MGHIELGEVLKRGHSPQGFARAEEAKVSTHAMLTAKADVEAKVKKAEKKSEAPDPKPEGKDDGKLKHKGDAPVSTHKLQPKRRKLPGTPAKEERLEKVLEDNGEAWAKGDKAEEKAVEKAEEKAESTETVPLENRFSK